MATDAKGSHRELVFIEETTFGETPSSPTMEKLRTTGDTIALNKNTQTSGELRSDRQITDVRHGNRRVGGDINFELIFGDLDAFLEAAMFSTFSTAYSLSSLDCDVTASSGTVTRNSGSWIDDGVEVDDVVTFSGFNDSGNNDTFTVESVTDSDIVVADSTGMADETGTTGVGVTTTAEVLTMGTTLKTFSIEKAFTDISQYAVFRGVGVTTMNLTMQTDGMITGSFSCVGKDMDPISGTRLDADPTAPSSNNPFNTSQGTIKEAGSSTSIVTSINLTLENSLNPTFALFQESARSLIDGRSNVTGNVTIYVQDETFINKFINETESSLEFSPTDPDGNKYRFRLPRIKYNGAPLDVQGEGEITPQMPIQALYDDDAGTNLSIRKLPVQS
jgi:hypothetical protein